jgi:alcohol dehydrogenase class IV
VPANPGLPLIACPTTAGTGSEVTPFAVCYEGLRKYSFAHPFLQPSAALIDPDLTATVPREQAASCALDALAQLIESFWAISATDESRAYSRRGIPLLLDNVHAAVNRNDRNGRKALAEAAHLSGRAISIAKTTAAHAVSYPISQLWGLPHGHAVMMTLPAFVEFNAGVTEHDCTHPLGAGFVRELMQELISMLGARDAREAAARLDGIVGEIGLHRDFPRAGITDDSDIQRIAQHVNVERMRNNPRALTEQSLLAVLRAANSGVSG